MGRLQGDKEEPSKAGQKLPCPVPIWTASGTCSPSSLCLPLPQTQASVLQSILWKKKMVDRDDNLSQMPLSINLTEAFFLSIICDKGGVWGSDFKSFYSKNQATPSSQVSG
jgi:hypothetical protein